jgi:hypothetical protein
VSPEDGQVMPEICRSFKSRIKVKVKCVSSWLCLLRYYDELSENILQVIWNDNVIYAVMNEYSFTKHNILTLCCTTINRSSVTKLYCLFCNYNILLCSSTYNGSFSLLYFIVLNVSLTKYPSNIRWKNFTVFIYIQLQRIPPSLYLPQGSISTGIL